MKHLIIILLISSTILYGCINHAFSDDPRCWQCTEVRTIENDDTHIRYNTDSSAEQICNMTYRQKSGYENGQSHYIEYGNDSIALFTTSCK